MRGEGENPLFQGIDSSISPFLLRFFMGRKKKISSERERRKESLKLSFLLMCTIHTNCPLPASLCGNIFTLLGMCFNLNILYIFGGLGVLIAQISVLLKHMLPNLDVDVYRYYMIYLVRILFYFSILVSGQDNINFNIFEN